MSLDDDAVRIAKEGHFYIADSGTARPTNLTAPESPWNEVGHTKQDSPFTITRDGGDVTKKGTWQKAGLRADVADVTYAIEWALLQNDAVCLGLYYGGGTTETNGGHSWFLPPSQPLAQEHALFVRIIDGDTEWPMYWPNVAIIGSDSAEESIDDFGTKPVKATILTPDTEVLAGLFAIKLPD